MKRKEVGFLAGTIAWQGLRAAETQVSGAGNVGIGSMSGGQMQVMIHQGITWESLPAWAWGGVVVVAAVGCVVVWRRVTTRPSAPAPAIQQVTGGSVQVGLSAQDVALLIPLMTNPQASAVQLAAVTQQLNERLQRHVFSEGVVQAFLATVKGKQVPPDAWPETFAELTRQYLELGQRMEAVPPSSERMARLMAQAETAREAGDWVLVDDCLNQASQLADEDAQQQAQKARDAARQAATLLASRGTLALTRLEREAGACFLAQAFERRKLDVDSESLWWLFEAGDALETVGDTTGALRLYHQAQQAAEAGGDALRRDLAASCSRVGEMQAAQGNWATALKSYQTSLNIAQTLAQVQPDNREWQRDLSVCHNKVGEVQVAQENFAAALKSYRTSLEIAKTLAQVEPDNRTWQRDLSVCHNKVGEVQVAQKDLAPALKSYQADLEIAQTLARMEPGNRGGQHDLSVSYNNVGDVQMAQEDFAAALKSYQAGLDIRQTLARVDQGNLRWQRDLSVSHDRMGNAQVKQGNLAAALKSYQASLEIRQMLERVDSGNAQWQVDVAVSCWKLGQELGSAGGSTAQRQAWLQQGLGVLQSLHREGRLAPNRQSWIGMFERALAALK